MTPFAPILAFLSALAVRLRPARRDALSPSEALQPIGAGGVANRQSGLGVWGMDPGATTAPAPAYRLNVYDQDILYEDNGYARRIVDEVVDDATRKGWRVLYEGQDEGDEELRALDEQLGAKAKIIEGAKAGRRYGTAFVMMVFDEAPNAVVNGGYSRVSLAEPPRRIKAIRNLVILDPDECVPIEWDTNPRSKGYRMPLRYQVAPSDVGDGLGDATVHASRLLIFRGYRLTPRRRRENMDLDLSVLQPAWAQLSNLTQADSALATHLQDASVGVLKIAGKAALDLSDQWTLVDQRAAELARAKSRVGILILDEGEEYATVAHNVSGMHEQHDRIKEGLSAVSGIPLTKMYGLAPGGLNADGESQAANWRETVSAFQQDDLAPELERYYTYQMQALGRDPSADWRIDFLPLDEPTEQQRAEQRKTYADIDAAYTQMGVYTADEIRAQRFGATGWQADIILTPALPSSPAGTLPPQPADNPLIPPRADVEEPRPLPQGAREELRRGLAWHEEGKSGDGLQPETVAWARRMAAGEAPSLAKLKKMAAWFARHEVDKQGKDWDAPSPGRVAWALWGGDAGQRWANAELKRLGLREDGVRLDPYTLSSTNLPPAVAALPEAERARWIAVFNGVHEATGDEVRAFRAAWSDLRGE